MIKISRLLAAENTDKLAVAVFRIVIGVMFLMASWGKVMAGSAWPERMLGFLHSQKDMPDWYQGIVESLIEPQASLFAYLTAYGELFLGLALILGIFVRPASLLGLFMVANFMFAKGHGFWVPSNHDSLYVFALGLLYFNHAEEFFGVKLFRKGSN